MPSGEQLNGSADLHEEVKQLRVDVDELKEADKRHEEKDRELLACITEVRDALYQKGVDGKPGKSIVDLVPSSGERATFFVLLLTVLLSFVAKLAGIEIPK